MAASASIRKTCASRSFPSRRISTSCSIGAARRQDGALDAHRYAGEDLRGGIRDHVGGGFHRYSTDRYWRVPHFEKMLYDNGQLASVYARAYELEPREDFRRVVDETLEFLLRELADPAGGFYSALDAETDSQEGRYYVWERKEVEAVLTPAEFKLWAEIYGLAGEPNFEGRYIPLLSRPLADEAKSRQMTEADLNARLQTIREKLIAVRSKRPRPLTDTKVLCGWNGLVIRGLADAGRVLKNPRYTAAAAKAADFVLAKMRDPSGHLQRSFAAGAAKVPGYLDDYALFIDGMIALHQATGEDRWLTTAGQLAAVQITLFADERLGGFFYTSTEHEKLIAQQIADGHRDSLGQFGFGNEPAQAQHRARTSRSTARGPKNASAPRRRLWKTILWRCPSWLWRWPRGWTERNQPQPTRRRQMRARAVPRSHKLASSRSAPCTSMQPLAEHDQIIAIGVEVGDHRGGVVMVLDVEFARQVVMRQR